MILDMKIFLRFFVILTLPHLAFANNYASIDYQITPNVQFKTPYVKIEAEIRGHFANKLVLNLPYKWAGADYVRQIRNIKLSNSNIKYSLKRKGGHQLILNIPSQTDCVKISYEIHQKAGDPSNVHETIVRHDLIHGIGHGLFIVPNDIKEADQVGFNIAWKKLPAEWKTISSYAITPALNFVGGSAQLLAAIYVAGKVRLKQIGTKHNPVHLSLYREFDLPDDSIASSLREIISTQRSFFNDQDFPYYAMSIIQGDDFHSMGGTRLNNSFTAYLPKGMEKKDYYILIAHEHLHNWTGGKINIDEQEELNYWWSEGFTEYYTRELALRSGGITLDEFVTECNQFLKSYYLSPVTNEPNIRIKKDFWNNYDVEKLPYYRGFVFAVLLNDLIKKHNANNSLDNVMLDLFKVSKDKNFSVELFKGILQKYIPKGVDTEISQYIEQGISIDLAKVDLPIEKVKKYKKEVYQFRSNLSAEDKLKIRKFFGCK